MNRSGFEEVEHIRYEDVAPSKSFRYGPREATGTLINSICMTLGGSGAFLLEELSRNSDQDIPLLSSFEAHPIVGTITLSLFFRVLAYFFRNGGSSMIGDIMTKLWLKIFKKVQTND